MAGADALFADVVVFAGPTDDGGDRRLPAKELLDRVGDDLRMLDELASVLAVFCARNAQKHVNESVTVSSPAVSSTKQMSSISSR